MCTASHSFVRGFARRIGKRARTLCDGRLAADRLARAHSAKSLERDESLTIMMQYGRSGGSVYTQLRIGDGPASTSYLLVIIFIL